MFSGELIEECLRARELYYVQPPLIPNVDCVDTGEDAAVDILGQWTKRIVNTALEAVGDALSPVRWVVTSRAAQVNRSSKPSGSTKTKERAKLLHRAARPAGKPSKSKKQGYCRPDGAGISVRRSPMQQQSPPPNSKNNGGSKHRKTDNQDRVPLLRPKPNSQLPLEIKPGSKWSSDKVFGTGEVWNEYGCQTNVAAPIRQIFTYCVEAKARYGCIVTTKEVVVVRIRPRKEGPVEASQPSSPTTNTTHATPEDELLQELADDGLLEFKSIPWKEHHHRRNEVDDSEEEGRIHNTDGNIDTCKTMTMNLAIWFQHILAGNNHQLQWRYGLLREEMLKRDTKARIEESKPARTPDLVGIGSFASTTAHSFSTELPEQRVSQVSVPEDRWTGKN